MSDKEPAFFPPVPEGLVVRHETGYRTVGDLTFRITSDANPEQYNVYQDGVGQVGYVRLRRARLTVDCPDCGGEELVRTWIGTGDEDEDFMVGSFKDEDQRDAALVLCAAVLHEAIDDPDNYLHALQLMVGHCEWNAAEGVLEMRRKRDSDDPDNPGEHWPDDIILQGIGEERIEATRWANRAAAMFEEQRPYTKLAPGFG